MSNGTPINPRKRVTHLTYRPDIDGLRAIAVLAVIHFHFAPLSTIFSGGFVGVDIFFVISGFLITNLIAKGIDENRFSCGGFYINRIIRIFPALLIVLFTSLVFGWFMYFPDKYYRLGQHISAGTLFISNFLLWREAGAGYFDVASIQKPLLHLWSLGIEEQFYIFWPLLFSLIYKRIRSHLGIIAFITIISFVLNILYVKSSPVATFYNPVSRFWEISSGAMLALVCTKDSILKSKFRDLFVKIHISRAHEWASLFGICLIIYSFIYLKPGVSYPGMYAVLPVFGTCLIIISGENALLNKYIFSNRLLVYIGLISYPLYLWHWPLLSWSQDAGDLYRDASDSGFYKIYAVIIAFILSALTLHFIERPARKYRTKKKALALVAISLLILFCGVFIIFDKGDAGRSFNKRTIDVWPEMLNKNEVCEKYFLSPRNLNVVDYCYIENASPKQVKTVLLGDSHANQLIPGLRESKLGHQGFLYIGAGGCPFISNWRNWQTWPPLNGPRRDEDFCPKVSDVAYEAVASMPPNIVVLSSRLALLTNHYDYVDDYRADWKSNNFPGLPFDVALGKQLRLDIKALLDAGRIVIFVHQIPELDFQPQGCSGISPPFYLSTSSDKAQDKNNKVCKMSRLIVEERQSEYRKIMKSVIDEINSPRLFVFDPLNTLCDENFCYAVVNNSVMYRDDNHLSIIGSKFIWNKLENEFDVYIMKNSLDYLVP